MGEGLPRLFLSILLLAAPSASQQARAVRVGEIEFFGYSGVDLARVRAALPLREGDTLYQEKWEQEQQRVREAVRQLIGADPTDVAATCCDAHGDLIIYIGLSGKPIKYLPEQRGAARLPASIIRLYDQTETLVGEAVRNGAGGEERSRGYSLSVYPPLRAIQLRLRAYAVGHESLVRRVLETSSDARQRAAAAEVLGFGRVTTSQINALANASRDRNDGVRNNATRALVVLAEADPEIARRIPPENFIEMVLSGTWTDLNKGGSLLSDLTRGRDKALLAKLRRREVLERLLEMARWRTDHANPARNILGRVAGIDEARLEQLVATKQLDVIIEALRAK